MQCITYITHTSLGPLVGCAIGIQYRPHNSRKEESCIIFSQNKRTEIVTITKMFETFFSNMDKEIINLLLQRCLRHSLKHGARDNQHTKISHKPLSLKSKIVALLSHSIKMLHSMTNDKKYKPNPDSQF